MPASVASVTEPAAPVQLSGPTPPRPLVVDVDHSLLRSDLFDETLIEGLRRQPLQTLLAFRRLRQGRAALKAQLAQASRLDVRVLPYNRDVQACMADAREQGRSVHLVSAADASLVAAIADHLGGVADHHGSTPDINLKGEHKAQWLAQRFGERGFDYVGDSRSDLRVWALAGHIHTVGLGGLLRRAVRRLAGQQGVSALHLSAPPAGFARWRPWRRLLRPRQWVAELILIASVWAFSGFVAGGLSASQWLAVAAYWSLGLAGRVVAGLWYAQPHRELRANTGRYANPLATGALRLRTAALVGSGLAVLGLVGTTAFGGWSLLPLALVHCSACAWSVALGPRSPWLQRLAGLARWAVAALSGLALV